MPCGCEGEGLHLPPVPEALSFACPDIKYQRKGCPSAGPYTPRHFAVTRNARVPPRHSANLRRRGHLAGHNVEDWLSAEAALGRRSEEHTSERQSRFDLV